MNETIFIITVVILALVTSNLVVSLPAYGQNKSGGQQQRQTKGKPFPVLLIHGYTEDATVWKINAYFLGGTHDNEGCSIVGKDRIG
jgi:hypothetical protein